MITGGCRNHRPAKIEVPFSPRMDHLSSFLEGTGQYAQEVTSSSVRIEEYRLIMERRII